MNQAETPRPWRPGREIIAGAKPEGGLEMEDRKCNLVSKPYYTVAEAATLWCNIKRTIHVDGRGLPEDDPINPCLRRRAQDIMLSIDEGVLRCGRDGQISFRR